MTVAALPSTIAYLENGVATQFAAPFRYNDPSNLVVLRIAADGTIIPLTYNVDFTATAGDTDAGGEVIPTTLSSGTRLLIRRQTPRIQDATYTTGDRFPAATTENAFDLAMLIAQEQADTVADIASRTPLVPDGETVDPLPPAAQRRGLVLGFDPTTGAMIAVPNSSILTNVLDDGLWNATDPVVDDGAWG